MKKVSFLLLIVTLSLLLFLIQPVSATDTQVWQGQYFTGSKLNVGTFNFNFTIFDKLTGGVPCYSNTSSIAANSQGWWETLQYGVLDA